MESSTKLTTLRSVLLSMTHLSSDGVVSQDIQQLVKHFKPGQIAARQHSRAALISSHHSSFDLITPELFDLTAPQLI